MNGDIIRSSQSWALGTRPISYNNRRRTGRHTLPYTHTTPPTIKPYRAYPKSNQKVTRGISNHKRHKHPSHYALPAPPARPNLRHTAGDSQNHPVSTTSTITIPPDSSRYTRYQSEYQPAAGISHLDSSRWNVLLRGGIQRRAGARLVLLVAGTSGGVFFAVGPEAGDFQEHAEEGENAVRERAGGLVIWTGIRRE